MEQVRLTSDVVLLATLDFARPSWHVLMVQRRWEPFTGCWALPGGHVDDGETFVQAAARELTEETGLTAHYLRALGVYDDPNRDPRGRDISCAFVSVIDRMEQPTAGDDAADARWLPASVLLARPDKVAFDHVRILADALRHVDV